MLKLVLFVSLLVCIFIFKREILNKERFLKTVSLKDLATDFVLVVLCSITKGVTGFFFVNFVINVICFFIGFLLFVMLIRDAWVYFKNM